MASRTMTIRNRRGKSAEYRITTTGQDEQFLVHNLKSGEYYMTTLDGCTCPSREQPCCKHVHGVTLVYLELLANRPLIGLSSLWRNES
jgi:uncharacterized Zn finger protein